jgi:succinate dehydrogenase/fumarate reductase flavoprotein subunit
VGFVWGPDNSRALEAGILRRAETLTALAEATGITEPQLSATLAEWNAYVAAGRDEAWQRPAASMVPIGRSPFVFAQIWPIVSNTQGGPVHDAQQRVLRPDGQPIPGLFAAGELGSTFGHLYLSGGNIAECLVGGAIAGRNAAQAARGTT